jgi:hypothetical protein
MDTPAQDLRRLADVRPLVTASATTTDLLLKSTILSQQETVLRPWAATKLLILQTHFSTDTKKMDTKNKEHPCSGIARKLWHDTRLPMVIPYSATVPVRFVSM